MCKLYYEQNKHLFDDPVFYSRSMIYTCYNMWYINIYTHIFTQFTHINKATNHRFQR